MYQNFVTPALKFNEKNLILLLRYFDIFTGTQNDWFTAAAGFMNTGTNTDTQSRGGFSSVLFFSVYLCIQKQQSSPSEHIHACVCIHPHFFVYNTTGALEAAWEHDQMNTEALISQQRKNMLPYSALKQRRMFLTSRFFSSPEWWQTSRSEPNTDNVLCSAFA